MVYRGNSNNLFQMYSSASIDKKKPVESEPIDSSKEIIEYNQRHKSSAKTKQEDSAKPCKVIVHIGGMQHMLSAPDQDGEAFIRLISERADRMISQIQQENAGMSIMNSFVLSIVNAMDELYQSEKKISNLEAILLSRDQEIKSIKSEYFQQREVNWELKKEVLRLKEMANHAAMNHEVQSDDNDDDMLPLEQMVFSFNEYDTLTNSVEFDETEESDYLEDSDGDYS